MYFLVGVSNSLGQNRELNMNFPHPKEDLLMTGIIVLKSGDCVYFSGSFGTITLCLLVLYVPKK